MGLLKSLRERENLSVKNMAKKLGISESAYYAYESGRRIIPYDVLALILEMRGTDEDLKLVKIIREING